MSYITKGNKELCPVKHESKFIKFSEDFPKPKYALSHETGVWSKCSNIKYIDETNMDSELYNCDTCGLRYRLYYDDMR